jgi:hypothetical protein
VTDISIQVDPQQLEHFARRLDEKRLARAVRKAGNDAIRTMQRASINSVRSKKRIKIGTVRRRLPLVLPTQRASLEELTWRMKISGKPISLGAYPSKQTHQGVSVEINVGSRKVFRHAFLRVVRSNGFRGVFVRGAAGAPRYPIKSLVSSSIGDTFKDPGTVDSIREVGRTVMSSSFKRYAQQEIER